MSASQGTSLYQGSDTDFVSLICHILIRKRSFEAILHSGHAQDSLPDKHISANGESPPRLSDAVGARENEPASDIFRIFVRKTAIQFREKCFSYADRELARAFERWGRKDCR